MTLADRLKEDEASHPRLFIFRGPMERRAVEAWEPALVRSLPAEIVDFWVETGGGDIFESEVFLHPLTLAPGDLLDVDGSDEVMVANRALRLQGLPDEHFVFLSGAYIGSWRATDGKYVLSSSRDWQASRTFPSLESWYLEGLRPMFAGKYGLPARR